MKTFELLEAKKYQLPPEYAALVAKDILDWAKKNVLSFRHTFNIEGEEVSVEKVEVKGGVIFADADDGVDEHYALDHDIRTENKAKNSVDVMQSFYVVAYMSNGDKVYSNVQYDRALDLRTGTLKNPTRSWDFSIYDVIVERGKHRAEKELQSSKNTTFGELVVKHYPPLSEKVLLVAYKNIQKGRQLFSKLHDNLSFDGERDLYKELNAISGKVLTLARKTVVSRMPKDSIQAEIAKIKAMLDKIAE